ncbi:MAG: class I adenylate cyclase, partial [Smithellaceae bacterium]|nr:class I adenylate cyclase [Smithellaceae bacterium]
MGQTSKSDCDIWICIRRDDFNNGLREQLQEKARLIKDWLDTQIRMPVFFFHCNVEDIRDGNFGQVELESSGSAQKNVLKEEFYRTLILICGKIPLWWVCWSPEGDISYEETASGFARDGESDHNFLDLGNIETVAPQEYFGATLWQFNKSLTQPLKSIIKMILLRMVVTSPAEELLCHSFRNHILAAGKQPFIDPAFFVTRLAFDYLRGKDEKVFAFVRKCFYLSYDMKLLTKNVTYRETLAQDLFSGQGLEEREILHLNAFSDWNYQEQIRFGTELFSLLRMIYSEINALQGAMAGELTPRDVTVLGRKLASCLAQKPHKVPVLRKPMKNDNPPYITFKYANQGVWHTYPAEEESPPLMAHRDILYCIAYLVWNDALSTDQVHMVPNITAVTMQEIINMA